jgi:hypothetical protein
MTNNPKQTPATKRIEVPIRILAKSPRLMRPLAANDIND